jgi:hypothetical protein
MLADLSVPIVPDERLTDDVVYAATIPIPPMNLALSLSPLHEKHPNPTTPHR